MKRPTFLLTFTVTGQSAFPIDMLRYASAWPATTEDVMTIANSLRSYCADTDGPLSVTLRCYVNAETGIFPERWRSFGWFPDVTTFRHDKLTRQ